jgi:vitamin B12 transporter
MLRQFIERKLIAVYPALLSAGIAQATDQEAIELDTLVVTAGLQPLMVGEIASSVTIITREEIELKQYRFLSDLLRDVPGFSISQAGGAGSQTQVRVRGSEANHLLVLMDGVRANDPAGNDEFQYHLSLGSNIERVEIVRGPQSATWGSDAIAGVVNIIRRKDNGRPYVAGSVEGGSFDSTDASLEAGYATERWRLNAWLSHLKTDGSNLSRTGSEADGAENTSGNITFDLQAGDAIDVHLSAQRVDATSEYDDIDYFFTGLPVDADRYTKSQQSYLNGEVSYAPLHGTLYGSFSVQRLDSAHDNFADGAWADSTAADTLEYRLRGGVEFGHGHHANVSLEREQTNFEQRGAATPWGDPNQDQSFSVNGFAVEYVGQSVDDFTWTLSGRVDDYSDFEDATTWQAAASWQASPALRLRGSLGTGSKAPTFTERYGYFADLFAGNPELVPESSRGWEIGLDFTSRAYHAMLQLAWFNQDLEDEIDGFVFDTETSMYTARNKPYDSQRKGVEAVVEFTPAESFRLAASYTYTDATERGADGEVSPEARRPRHMAGLFATCYFAHKRGSVSLNVDYNGEQQDLYFSPVTYASERVTMDAYTVVDLAASWRLTKALEVTGRISNLLDTEYEEVLGFVRPRRGVYAGLRGRFESR